MPRDRRDALSPLEFHVLLAVAERPRHGYAIADAVAADSDGAVAPRAGSLYRVIARLVAAGWLAETAAAEEPEPHPGLARRYYALSSTGRQALAAESERIGRAAAAARERLAPARSRM